MGQKVNPLGFRLGVTQKHISHWFIDNARYSQLVVEDQFIRHFFYKRFPGIASINIKRDLNKIVIEIFSSNTRDLFIEGNRSTTSASPSSSQKASSPGQVEGNRVDGTRSSTSSNTSNSGNQQIDNLCGQLLKELTIYRNSRAEKDMFKNKKWFASQVKDRAHDKEQTVGSTSTASPNLATFGQETGFGNTKKPVDVELFLTRVEDPNRSAACLAEFIVEQLEKRVPFRRVLKRSIQKAEEASVEGIKVQISGRLNGAEIARSERIHKGQVPLHTLRAKIEYTSRTAKTIYGLLGVKVWVFNGFADVNDLKILNQK